MKYLGLTVLCGLLLAMPALADDPMSTMPPDIAAIINKMKAGGRPTADDLAKLRAWQQGVVSHVNAPTPPGIGSGSAQPEGIPCKVRVSLDFTATSPGTSEQGHVEAYTDTMLYAVIAGNADYSKSVLNPDAKSSSFRFMPILPKPGETKRPAIGGGVGNYYAKLGTASLSIRGSLSRVGFGVMLTTTGQGDSLWASGAGIMAELDGTEVAADPKEVTTRVNDDASASTAMGGLAAPFVDEQRHSMQMGQPTPAPLMNLSYKALVDAIRSGKTGTVSGSETFSFVRNDGKRVTGSASIAITVRPTPLELVIEPADEKVFKDWNPTPDDKEVGGTYFGHPKPLEVHIALHDRTKGEATSPGPTKPNADVGGQIVVQLTDVSTYHGVTMNFPKKGTPEKKPEDMYFPTDQPHGTVWVSDTQVKTASHSAVEATVRIAVRDTAAYGKLSASIDALGIESYDPRSKTKSMTVPLDENMNHIADGWERQNEVYDQHLPENWDEDADPDGMQNKGDGIVMFDEYRGFVIGEPGTKASFQRLTPKTKELFVMPIGPEAALFKPGATKFGQITGIKVLLTREEFAEAWSKGKGLKRWVNFNETPWSQQASAVRVEDRGTDISVTGSPGAPGQTWFVDMAVAENADGQPPQEVEYLNVSSANCGKLITDIRVHAFLPSPLPKDVSDAIAAGHLDLDKALANSDPKNPAFFKLVSQCVAYTTMHELGHATGAVHHGAKRYVNNEASEGVFGTGNVSCPMYYWQSWGNPSARIEWLAGSWDPSQSAPNGHDWRFCTDSANNDWGHMKLK